MQALRVLGVAALLGTFASAASAQGWIEPIRPLPQNPAGPIERLRSAVQVSISNRLDLLWHLVDLFHPALENSLKSCQRVVILVEFSQEASCD